MPSIGTVRRNRDCGRKGNRQSIWHACVDCGKERWVQLCRGKPESLRCRPCGMFGRHSGIPRLWKGGRYIKDGYICVLQKGHPRTNSNGYVKQATLVLEEALGRYLLPRMVIHHVNGVRDDDRLENLVEISQAKHMAIHNKERVNA